MHFLFSILAVLLYAGMPDGAEGTGLQDTLRTSSITAQRGITVSRNDVIHIEESQNVVDALQLFPTLQVSDIGGMAGLKTAGLRGMGTAHTEIYIDGIKVGNVQSGQGDLGMLPMETFGSATVDYAQNSLSFSTSGPVFEASRRFAGKIGVKGGSFGTWNPFAKMDWKLSEPVAISVNFSGIKSEGDFPYGDGQIREGNDISQWHGGVDLFGKVEEGRWLAKVFANYADRGTPGSLSWPSDDRQKDKNAFVQGSFDKRFGAYTLAVASKLAYDDVFYKSSWGDSDYLQKEMQFNTTHSFSLTDWLSASLRTEMQWDNLASDYYNAQRFSGNVAAGGAIKAGPFSADAALVWKGASDKGNLSRSAFEPSADFRLSIIDGLDIVAFGRRAYRIPTFNELYYAGYGNPDLLCEDAWLSDIGLEWMKSARGWTTNAKVNGFHYSLKNKISSAPSPDDPNIWMPYNIGRVSSRGVDASLSARWSNEIWSAGMTAKYSLLNAIDKTPDAYTFGQQIPYAAKHSAVLGGNASYRGWSIIATWNYRAGRMDSYGEMPDWNTVDATMTKSVRIAGSEAVFSLCFKNLANQMYELSSGYPMPGRSITAGIEIII